MTTNTMHKPGDVVTWKHFMADGQVLVRTGVVIDRAPAINARKAVGITRREMGSQLTNWWVIPDEWLDTDLYRIIAVGRASRYLIAHGEYLNEARLGHQFVIKGQLYSSNHAGSPLGAMTVRAAQVANKVRE